MSIVQALSLQYFVTAAQAAWDRKYQIKGTYYLNIQQPLPCLVHLKDAQRAVNRPLALVQELKFLAAPEEQLKSPNLSTQINTRWVITGGASAAGSKSGVPCTPWRREHGEQGRALFSLVYLRVSGLREQLWSQRGIHRPTVCEYSGFTAPVGSAEGITSPGLVSVYDPATGSSRITDTGNYPILW